MLIASSDLATSLVIKGYSSRLGMLLLEHPAVGSMPLIDGEAVIEDERIAIVEG